MEQDSHWTLLNVDTDDDTPHELQLQIEKWDSLDVHARKKLYEQVTTLEMEEETETDEDDQALGIEMQEDNGRDSEVTRIKPLILNYF